MCDTTNVHEVIKCKYMYVSKEAQSIQLQCNNVLLTYMYQSI